MLESLLAEYLFGFLLVFTRVGATLMAMPGIGDAFVLPRVRLLLALAVAAVVHPTVADGLPPEPDSPIALLALLVGEAAVGLFFGFIARLLVAALDLAGHIISFELSLANAFVFNPSMASQGSMIGAFLTITALMLMFVTNMHHLVLMAMVDSYTLWPPGSLPPFGDMADHMARLLAESFLIGLQIAAPVLVVGLIFKLGLGLLSRLMPAVQVFFIAIPAQIMLGVTVLSLTLSAMLLFWLDRFQNGFAPFLAP